MEGYLYIVTAFRWEGLFSLRLDLVLMFYDEWDLYAKRTGWHFLFPDTKRGYVGLLVGCY